MAHIVKSGESRSSYLSASATVFMSVCLVATLALCINERQNNANLKSILISDIRTQLDGLKEGVQETGIYLEQFLTLVVYIGAEFSIKVVYIHACGLHSVYG